LESNWSYTVAEAGMAKNDLGMVKAARFLSDPNFYAVSFGVPGETWIGWIDYLPFSGPWGWYPFSNYVGLPFPGPWIDDVEPDVL